MEQPKRHLGFAGKLAGVKYWRIEGEEIDGSLIVEQDMDEETGRIIATTATGDTYYWKEDSYRVEPHTPLITDGEWIKC